MWFIENRPELFKRAYKWAHIDAFINNRLCDAVVSSPGESRFGPFDFETLQWSEELCEATGIPIDKLAEIKDSGTQQRLHHYERELQLFWVVGINNVLPLVWGSLRLG